MGTASRDGLDLELRVRRELIQAGFVVEPSLLSADGGLGVWHDPTRGVIITWGTSRELAANHLAKYDTIRTAVKLALRTVLTEAGHEFREDFGGLELVVTS